jgi:hypothetical protein
MRQTVAAFIDQQTPWSRPKDVPLDPNEVFSLACMWDRPSITQPLMGTGSLAKFIVNCLSTNPPLPFKVFLALTTIPASPKPGDNIKLG